MNELNEWMAAVETRLEVLERRFQQSGVSGSASAKPISVKEFLLEKDPKSEAQKVLVLAYYLEHHQGISPVNVPDLEKAFMAAREKRPKNLNDAVNKAVARGLMMEAEEKKDSKKAWLVTTSGEKAVEGEKDA